jgi:diadenosine tetraphosphate (Ap4A) HIT family hydrolase
MSNTEKCIGCDWQPNQAEPIANSRYWRADLIENQAYLGRSILSLKRHVERVSDLTAEEWIELKDLINQFEMALTKVLGATSFNWTVLMNDAYKMEDPKPHVHFHLWPRHRNEAVVNEEVFVDPNFAHHYDKNAQHIVSPETFEAISNKIKQELKF